MENYDFCGWATKNDLQCSDGRIIRRDAFKHNDGQKVPLVWNHDHTDPYRVVGHALLENRDEGVYTYGYFNDTDLGNTAKIYVQHGDINQLSIYANQLKQQGPNVMHGNIREVSLVLAGANPGAYIESVIAHDDESDEEAVIYTGENISLSHAEGVKEETKSMAESSEKTVKDVFDTLTEDQKNLFYTLIGKALEGDGNEDNENDENDEMEQGDEDMKHNVFDTDTNQKDEVLAHSEILNDIVADAKRYGSLKESFLQHAAANNITNYNYLLPEPKSLNTPPEWIKEDDSWVAKVMRSVHHTPFSRVKSMFATLDETEARARGYIKGNMKKDMALSVLKRTTSPTTVYIKMKMDRDDVVDITDFDVVAWQRAEMRGQLDRELARAMLLGDGRELSSDDKINEQNIRPVLKDDDMYTIKYTVKSGQDYKVTTNSASDNDSVAKGVIRAAIKSRKEYKGSGNPTFFTTEDLLTELLLIEDQNGRRIYDSINTLATAMRVKEIVTVPEMESHTDIYGIIVNMADYTTGADKGGAVNMFDDFDIDYNQMKYLMETRMSGALTKPYSAIVLKKEAGGAGASEAAG